jgi:hypothetical protein
LKKNQLGSWYGWEITSEGICDNESLVQRAMKFRQACSGGSVSVKHDKRKNNQLRHRFNLWILAKTWNSLKPCSRAPKLIMVNLKPTGTKKLTGKEEYKSWTIPQPVTDKDWINHLEGKSHLGSVVIHDDSTCTWGVIDIDRYGMDFKTIH